MKTSHLTTRPVAQYSQIKCLVAGVLLFCLTNTANAQNISSIISSLLFEECPILTEPPLKKCISPVIETQEQVNLFSKVTVIRGHLQIEAKQDLDLSPFNNLREIQGILYIHQGELTTINGFNNLEAVGTRAAINGNGKQIYIEQNPKLISITGFQKLKKSTHPQAGSPSILIRFNDSLTDINAFESLDQAGLVSIRYNSRLTQISGFDSLHTIDSGIGLTITNSVSLTSIPSFSKLNVIDGWFEFYDLPNLNTIPSFQALTYTTRLRIHNLGISQMNSFKNSGFITTGGVIISRNRNLTLISGLTNLRSIEGERGDVYISDNLKLNRVTGFNSFNSFINNDPTDYISISENPELDCSEELFMMQPVAYSSRNLVECATTPYQF